MSYLLEILGRGLLAELSAAFRDLLHDDGHYSTAELRSAFESSRHDPSPAIMLGTRYLANRDYAAARRTFEATLSIDPTSLAARVGLACVCDELGRTEQAVGHLKLALKDRPHDATVLFALGFCHEKWGRAAEAVADYNTCLQAAPNLRNAHERLAAIRLRQNDLDQAIQHYEQICWYEPGEVVPALTLANLYLQAGRTVDAIRRYQFALTIEPDNWEVRDDLVAAYEQAGLYREAIQQLSEMIATQPAFADNHLRLGNLYAKVGNDSEALNQYMTALELHPDYLEAAVKVGTAHLRAGGYLEAALWFSRSVEINDRILSAYVGLGVAQHELGQTDEALASFEMATSVEPNSTLLFAETARLQLKMAVNRQVERYLSPAQLRAGADPAIADPAENELAPGVADLIDRQIQRHRAALADRPNYADLHYRLGVLLKQRGDLTEAVRCFRSASAINPAYAKALIQLGLTLYDMGSAKEAIGVLGRAVDVDPEAIDLHYQLGLIFADGTQFDLAVEQFEEAVRRDPRNIDFHANLALALQNMGLIDRAAASWQTLAELATQTPEGGELLDRVRREIRE